MKQFEVKFDHEKKNIYQALGFKDKQDYKQFVREVLDEGIEKLLGDKDNRAILVFAVSIVKNGMDKLYIIPTVKLLFDIITDKVKLSHIVELVYRKLQLYDGKELVMLAKNAVLADELSDELEKMLVSIALKSLKQFLGNDDTDSQGGSTN